MPGQLTNLKRLPKPMPLFAGIRPYPWLAVHPAGHPHEGRPIERTARCGVAVSQDGECCDVEFEQRMIDPVWLAAQSPRRRLAFQEQCPTDPDGVMWDRARCNRHESAALGAEAEAGRVATAPTPWWGSAPADDPPTSDDLFGGRV